jgi:hypothetical protein
MMKIEFIAKNDPSNTLTLFDNFIKDLDATDESIKKQLDDIGYETAEKMIEIIDDNKVRPQADDPKTLEANINTETFEDGFGVGDIQALNENAPYWPAINWGSSHMVGKRVPNGYFSPGQPNPTPDAFRQGRWNTGQDQGGMAGGNTGFAGSGKGHWSFIVNQPIPPMNYIEKTADWLDIRISAINFR